MVFNYKGKLFRLFFKKKIIPVGLVRIVRNFNNEPEKSYYIKGNRLEGKVALVTGAYKGIGLSIAKRLLQDGAKVIITGRNITKLQDTVNNLSLKGQVAFIEWDISDKVICNSNFDIAEKIFGRIDILVNNAGVTTDRGVRLSFEQMDLKHIHYVHDINTLGTRRMCETFIERYNHGTILNIISNTSIIPAQDAYYMSKWALYAYTKNAGERIMHENKMITINGLCPGPIKTDMTFGPRVSLYREHMPNRRIGLSEEIAELAFVQIIAGLNGKSGEITVCDGGESLV